MGRKEVAAAVLDPKHEIYVVHVRSVSSNALPSSFPLKLNIHPSRRPHIFSLIAEKARTKIPAEYLDFVDIFSLDLAFKLPEHSGINNHAIKPVDGQQPLYGPIYHLALVKLGPLKAYIETNLANAFIKPSKSLAGTPILSDQKSDGSLRLYINYQGLNNLTIKNRYPLPLIEESLDRLERAKQFTQLNLTSAYHWMRIRKGDKWKIVFRT